MTAAEVRYAFLDMLPEHLYRPTLANVHGRVISRGEAVLQLREALLDGRLPDKDAVDWPENPAIRAALLGALRDSNVAPYCNGDPEITDDVVLFTLQVVDDAHHLYDRALVAFHTLARKDEHDPLVSNCRGGGCRSPGIRRGPRTRDEAEWGSARADAARLMAIMLRSRTKEAWKERIAAMRQLADLFGQLASCLGLPPGTARGMLRALPRSDVIEMQAALRHLPALQELIRTLGRMKQSDDPDAPTALERIGCAVERIVEVDRPVVGERGTEVRGIERSGEVSRMLPSEAAMLTSPALRMLWRARWAERALLAYHAPGVLTQRVSEKQTFEDGETQAHLRAERGPIQVILDTSGSMMGTPERVAKAVTLQLLAVAHMEQRRCYVFNFSGLGDLAEHELSFDGDGLMHTLAFISDSFHGGTVPGEAIRRACKRLATHEWRQSDIVLISDGEFTTESPTHRLMKRARRDSAARFHGVRTGTGEGFADLRCDSIHDLLTWFGPTSFMS